MSWSRHRRSFDGMNVRACAHAHSQNRILVVFLSLHESEMPVHLRKLRVCDECVCVCDCKTAFSQCLRSFALCTIGLLCAPAMGFAFLFALYFMRLRLRVWCVPRFVLSHFVVRCCIRFRVQSNFSSVEHYAFVIFCSIAHSAPRPHLSFALMVFTWFVFSLTRTDPLFLPICFVDFVCWLFIFFLIFLVTQTSDNCLCLPLPYALCIDRVFEFQTRTQANRMKKWKVHNEIKMNNKSTAHEKGTNRIHTFRPSPDPTINSFAFLCDIFMLARKAPTTKN